MNKRGLKRIFVIPILIIISLVVIFWFIELVIDLVVPKCTGDGGIMFDSSEPCCYGLDSIPTHTEYISIEDKCYMFINGADTTANIWCFDCGNGKCKSPENKCNCPEDCNNKPPKYNITEEFCSSIDFKKYCGPGAWASIDECKICPNYKKPF